MSNLFETYKKWRMLTETEPSERDLGPDYEDNLDYGDKKAFMKYAKLKKLDHDDFEELELQYDEYLIEMETE